MRRDLTALVILACLTGFLPACSRDKHVFRSTVFRPTTVSIRDLVSKEIVWSNDIPVYHKLVVNLNRKDDYAPFRIGSLPAKVMKWKLVNQLTKSTVDKGSVRLPDVPIIIEPTIRQGPEVPPSYRQAAVPANRELGAMVERVEPASVPVYIEPPPVDAAVEDQVPAAAESLPEIDEPAEGVQDITDSGVTVDEEQATE